MEKAAEKLDSILAEDKVEVHTHIIFISSSTQIQIVYMQVLSHFKTEEGYFDWLISIDSKRNIFKNGLFLLLLSIVYF